MAADLLELAYATLTLSLPFMGGVIVGRGFRQEPKANVNDPEYRVGAALLTQVRDLHSDAMFVGSDDFVCRRHAMINVAGKPSIYLTISTAEDA